MEAKTKTNSGTERTRSCIDVTARDSTWQPDYPSLQVLAARFCTQPEVKFHVFRQLKRGEEKSIFFLEHHVDSIKQIKKKHLSYTL